MFRAAAFIRAETPHGPRACPQVNKNCGPSTHGRHSATAGGDHGGVWDPGRSRSQPAEGEVRHEGPCAERARPEGWNAEHRAPSTPAGAGRGAGSPWERVDVDARTIRALQWTFVHTAVLSVNYFPI